MSRIVIVLWLLAVMAVLTACGGAGGRPSQTQSAAGDPTRGKDLFAQATLAGNPGCSTCHSLQAGTVLVGPSMAGVATIAASTVTSQGYTGKAKTAEDFLRESIVDPNVYIAPGFAGGLMPQNWGQALTQQQISDLVAYLMSLK